MKIKCEFCDGYITELDETCPHCGATNPAYRRESNETPKTIEELQKWYVDHNLPPKEVTRFFIGENYTGPRAFGIYQDGERFIVYKNKDDGSRATRYDGSDEAYAVNELYLKLKERISEEKAKNTARSNRGYQPPRRNRRDSVIGFVTVAVIILIAFVLAILETDKGYYNYKGDQYYYLDNDWYIYDTYSNSWYETTVDEELSGNAKEYFESGSYDSSYGTSNFEDTSYYSTWEESNSSSSDWDSDSSWSSSDSWDSGGGDWGSDW